MVLAVVCVIVVIIIDVVSFFVCGDKFLVSEYIGNVTAIGLQYCNTYTLAQETETLLL